MRSTALAMLFAAAAACGPKSPPPPTGAIVDCNIQACGAPPGAPAGAGRDWQCIRSGDRCGWEARELPVAAGACVTSGCSGTMCGEPGNEMVTTCEFKPEYACYGSARCERQADKTCGWTQTPELTACLANPPPLQ